ncbi:MAG: hypothetical protein ACREBD_18780 [Blastocatellia bacterium]
MRQLRDGARGEGQALPRRIYLLKEALTYDVWELTKSVEREGDIHYNLACCVARLHECEAGADPGSWLDEALAQLAAAAVIGSARLTTLFNDLNNEKGDLIALSRCPHSPIQTELSRIKSDFEKVWTRKGVPLL